jgi:hypothetical protein
MTALKERVTITVDHDLIEAANEAVASGRVSSLSAWVNAALVERAAKERQLRAMADAVAEYEAEFGAISETELVAQQRADRRKSIAVREPRKKLARSRRRKVA